MGQARGSRPVQRRASNRAAPSGYTISADENILNNTTSPTTGFTFANAIAGTTYSYTISSSGGGTPVTGSGIVASAGQNVTPINVASLPNGTLSFNVTLTNGAGSGLAATAAATLEQTVPSGYTIVADQSSLDSTTATAAGFTFSNAVVGATYSYSVSSTGGGTPVTGSSTVTSAAQDVTGINVSSLSSGTLTFSVAITNGAGAGQATSATTTLS